MHTGAGRPRSETARTAVLHAVDDLLVEVGYAAMTMKGIAERAGVGRQTVYRWWSTKAEILVEAVGYDAAKELAVTPSGSAEHDFTTYVRKLGAFLTASDAGIAYRALLGEAQHDPVVAALLGERDVVAESARTVVAAALPKLTAASLDRAVAQLVGPTLFWALTNNSRRLPAKELATDVVAAVGRQPARRAVSSRTSA